MSTDSRGQGRERIYLSPPHMGGQEQQFVDEAFASNWIAPLGPQVDAFERELAEWVGAGGAAAVSSGTAALHLALRLLGVEAGDSVVVSTLTFIGSANPVVYQGADPVLVDAERRSWNMDPDLLEEHLEDRARSGELPAAVVVVHVYGQTADMDAIMELCGEFGVPVVEDAAEALGATHRGRQAGTIGDVGIYSFNGNKIITTSGGGMLVSDRDDLVDEARRLAAQAKEEGFFYRHDTVGYNYRLSNVLAGIGRGQLRVLEDRVDAHRRNFDFYHRHLSDLPGIRFMPEAEWGRATRWLTAVTIDPDAFGHDRSHVRQALEEVNAESRPLWRPLHLQPALEDCEVVGGEVAEDLFSRGLCLPSGSGMDRKDLERVVGVIRRLAER